MAAARLAQVGMRTLLVERDDRVGGRASTETIDGFLVNTGAAFWEIDGHVHETCRLVGAEFDVRVPQRSVVVRIGGREVCIDRFFGSRAQRLVLHAVAPKWQTSLDASLSVSGWLAQRTKHPVIHRTVRNLCASVFAVNSDELPAAVFLSYFTRQSAFSRMGQCPQGTAGVMRSLASATERHGAAVWLNSDVERLHIADGMVQGATIRRLGDTIDIACTYVVSDAGPAATLRLAAAPMPPQYQRTVEALEPCAMLTVNFATRIPLTRKAFGALLLADTDRLCGMVGFTATCPEMSPPGWHLYTAWSVPRPARGAFNDELELKLLFDELSRQFPSFSSSRIVSTKVMSGSWPAQRAMAGADIPRATPIRNLWNVGDGVKEHATGGTEACALTAILTVADILAQRDQSK